MGNYLLRSSLVCRWGHCGSKEWCGQGGARPQREFGFQIPDLAVILPVIRLTAICFCGQSVLSYRYVCEVGERRAKSGACCDWGWSTGTKAEVAAGLNSSSRGPISWSSCPCRVPSHTGTETHFFKVTKTMGPKGCCTNSGSKP